MALSSASFEPEPTEKCAVAAASPSKTIFLWLQRSHKTRLKLSQAEPRRWRGFDINLLPPRLRAKIFSQAAIVSSVLICLKPARRQVSSEHSTMKVAGSPSHWEAWPPT